MLLTAATFLLIIHGTYTGSMAPGVEVTVLMSAPARDEQHCRQMERDIPRTLSWLGIEVTRARCKEI